MPRLSLKKDHRQRLRDKLRDVGLKYSEQRLTVLAELEAATAPVTSLEMHERLAGYGWDQATTFRNLKDLCDAGLATRIDAGDHVWRFEVRRREDEHAKQHPHFLCDECGTVTCLHDVSILDATRKLNVPSGIHAVQEILLKGRCDECASPRKAGQK